MDKLMIKVKVKIYIFRELAPEVGTAVLIDFQNGQTYLDV